MVTQESFSQSSDDVLPSVTIITPTFHATIVSNKIVVEGTAFDNESGIQRVEAFLHPLPFDNTFPYKMATPIAPDDWSSWAIELDVNQTGTHRILARATDNAGNQNWYEVFVNVPLIVSNGENFNEDIAVNIAKPVDGAKLVSNKIVVEGTAFDNESGIQRVEAFLHPLPFDNTFPYKMATPIAPDDWSSWAIELDVNQTGTHRILARATDNEGKSNYSQITVETPFIAERESFNQFSDFRYKVALVEPTFTSAAYGPGGFYEFYAKYWSVSEERITQDLDLLTGDVPDVYDQQVDEYYEPLIEDIDEVFPESVVVVIRDEDVHDGNIFAFNNDNAYDALILLHDEYVTQQAYDNYRNFVDRGGTLVLVDSNTFYAEVSFDRAHGTVTLVKGHDWEFNGTEAKKSVAERYLEENREFIGSNYLLNHIDDDIEFRNNPFNYNHFEENQMLNSDAIILHDYDVLFPVDYPNQSHLNATIAAYELKFGDGKVISLGIYGTRVITEASFQEFWTDVILLHALNRSHELQVDDHKFQVYWRMDTGEISDMTVDVETKSLRIEMDRIEQEMDSLLISLPRELIDTDGTTESKLNVLLDGNQVSYTEYPLSHMRVLRIPLENDTSQIQIHGARVIPEFPLLYLNILIPIASIVIFVRIVSAGYKNRKRE